VRLQEYLSRIGVSSPVEPTHGTLKRLHIGHRMAFLFENVTIQTGGAIRLGLADLERKFLDEGKGGYCFEHNTLFAAALRDIGFAPITLLGRVRRGPPERWCRTHMILRVGDVLADVGFGAHSLLEPIALRDGAASVQGGLEYALRRDNGHWVLSARPSTGSGQADEAMDLYEFTDDPQTPLDVEVANHFTSTHPESVFRRTLTIQRVTENERLSLRNDTLTRISGGRSIDEPIGTGRLRAVARDQFGVTLPDAPLLFEQFSASVA
jgi:N-hydroxyarylamine O-acetyltransferase